MPAAITIRDDISSAELRHVARRKTDRRVVCRLLAIANALDGMSRERAAEQAGMDRQALRDWVIRYNADGVDGLHDRPRSGRPSFLDEGQMAVFRAMVLRGPDIERDGVSSWTAKDLCLLVERRFKTWIAAAEKASGQSAYQEALGLVDSAADHLSKIQDKILRRELEISVELARADVRQILDGPTETAKAAYTRVRDLARKAGDHRLGSCPEEWCTKPSRAVIG
jgi:transposase